MDKSFLDHIYFDKSPLEFPGEHTKGWNEHKNLKDNQAIQSYHETIISGQILYMKSFVHKAFLQ